MSDNATVPTPLSPRTEELSVDFWKDLSLFRVKLRFFYVTSEDLHDCSAVSWASVSALYHSTFHQHRLQFLKHTREWTPCPFAHAVGSLQMPFLFCPRQLFLPPILSVGSLPGPNQAWLVASLAHLAPASTSTHLSLSPVDCGFL